MWHEPLNEFGLDLKDSIIAVAEFLTLSDSRPGLIAALLVFSTVVLAIVFFLRTSRQLKAVKELDHHVRDFDGIEAFAEGYAEFQHSLKKDYRRNGPRGTVWEAWDEFNETIVLDDVEDGPPKLRNSIRPASFLNVEDLGFGTGLFRVLPNTLVSVGLFLTFLGLVAALHQFAQSMDAGSVGMDQAMRDFMQIASAKFVMSLVGLLCSIAFTILLRARQTKIDHTLRRLCTGIERRLVFVSLEDIGFRQLRAATEQREHLREIGYGMVAELQKPLEALPEKITGAIAERMDPIFDRVTSMGTSSMEGMVGDLSQQLSQSVGHALTRASESLGEATDRIGTMVDRMSEEGDALRFQGEGLFASGRSNLTNAKRDIVARLSQRLDEVLPCFTLGPVSEFDRSCNPGFVMIEAVQIEGHTDNRGTDRVNRNLSAARANSTFFAMTEAAEDVMQHLNLKMQPVLSVAAYGPDRPVASNNTPEGRATNRRIDLRFIMVTPQDTQGIEVIREALQSVDEQP